MAYRVLIRNFSEARYLCAIVNSEVALQAVIPMQAHGWRDPRHFDKLVWELPISEFNEQEALHRDLATSAAEAERTASLVELPNAGFRQ